MKKILKSLLCLLLVIPFVVNAAAEVTVNKSSSSIDIGGSDTITITGKEGWFGIKISSSDASVATVSKSGTTLDAYEANKTDQIVITGVKAGTATITVRVDDGTGKDGSDISGLSKTISVTVNPPKSDVKTLSDLKVNGTTVSGFATGTFTYDLGTLDAGSVNITATATDSKATISGTGTKNLEYGSGKTLVVKVTAQNGAVQNYTLKYVRKDNRDTDNTLSDLRVDGVTVSGFRKDKLEYTLNETLASSIKIEATCSSSKCAKIEGTGDIKLDYGNNAKKVVVTAENGSTQIYTIKISRKEDTNLSLTKLVVDGKEITLSAGKYTYTLDPTPNSSIKVEAVASSSDAKIEGVGTVNLDEGNNTKSITITSKTGNTTQTYTLNILRKGALDKVTIDGKNATMSADGKSFNYEVAYNTEKINLKALPTKENYTVRIILKSTGEEILEEFNLADKETDFVIEVTNENGTTTSYDLTVNKADEPSAVDDAESETSGTKISPTVLIVIIGVLLVVNIILAIYCVSLNNKNKNNKPKDNVDVI